MTTDSPHPWQLRIGGPDAIRHPGTAGPAVSDFLYEDCEDCEG
ncbi:hypothetical protein [Streptomyces sp. NBC_00576]|nr:hypothetical protein [Streptomyces sp. NBC_00576]WUB76753.1 hypothetical protein OG734_45680 [Streptomyces sp. NBC_00576]